MRMGADTHIYNRGRDVAGCEEIVACQQARSGDATEI